MAQRLAEFPRCAAALREGRLSLDQVGVIAEHAGAGSDDHYAELAANASVSQLRTAIKLEPKPKPKPEPEPVPVPDADDEPEPEPESRGSITATTDDEFTCWTIKLPPIEAAAFEAALQSHHDGLIAQWKRDHGDSPAADRPPMPTRVDAFNALVEAGWDAEATRRPHSHRTTVVVHVDVKDRIAALHVPTATAPPSSCMSMSKTASPPCMWGRCSRTPTAATWAVTPPPRSGSNATEPSSAPDAPPA
uniref:DUF222 domain-containing protein n=1 Tax=Mycolicibacterium litorale TaxID=758802 RepID=UPI0039088815